MEKRKLFSTRHLIRISILGTIGAILTILNFTVPGFPPFLSIDLGNVPAIIGAITMGPLPAVFIELIRNLIKFILDTSTGGVGELANFLFGISFIIPFALIFKKFPSTKGYIIAASVSTVVMTIFASVMNYFVMIPFYAALFGGMEVVLSLAAATTTIFADILGLFGLQTAQYITVTDLLTLVLYGIVPFNILKGVLMSVVGFLLYRSLRPVLRRF